MTITEAAKQIGCARNTIYERMRKYGWSREKAMTTPPRKMRKYNERGPCSVEGCCEYSYAKGFCMKCYAKARRRAIATGTWPNREARA